MKRMKQLLASLLVTSMLVAGLMITPLDVKATGETVIEEVDGSGAKTGVIFVLDAENYKFTNFWNENDAQRIAPTRDGFVFGGWYTNTSAEGTGDFTAVTTEGTTEANVWAKFVPAEVLSIRAQLQKETEDKGTNSAEGDKTYLRLLSAVNGLDYQKVGFDIRYNKTKEDSAENKEIATNITKVFSKITNQETDNSAMVASSLFGKAATHFSVLRLDGIGFKNYKKVIYVTPQWTTLDGTLVEGQAKYVRVIDGYATNRYISVPVNFISGSDVAAGQIELNYHHYWLQCVGFEAGTLMPEMNWSDDGNGTIKIVGNISNDNVVNEKNVAPNSAIYANLWFKVLETPTAPIPEGTVFEFQVDDAESKFCDWKEAWATTSPIAQDVKYWN